METVNLTPLELVALKTITYSDFYERGRDSILWDFSVYDICELKGKTRSGVFSSLVQKGIIVVTPKESQYMINEKGEKVKNPYYERGVNFGTIYITPVGYTLLDELQLIDEHGSFI